MTDKVEIIFRLDEELVIVRAWGGYDGFIEKHFADPHNALEYVAELAMY